MAFLEASWNKRNDETRYSGKSGRTDRIYIFPKALLEKVGINSVLIEATTHYLEDLKTYVTCFASTVGDRTNCPLCLDGNKRNVRFACFIFKYDTHEDGSLKEPIAGKVLPWLFGMDKKVSISDININYPVDTNDLRISCSDQTRQKLTISPSGESILLKNKDLLKSALAELQTKNVEMLKNLLAPIQTKEDYFSLVKKKNNLVVGINAGGNEAGADVFLGDENQSGSDAKRRNVNVDEELNNILKNIAK